MKTKRRAAYFFTSLKLFLREYRLFVLLGCLCLLGGVVVGVLSARSFGEDYYKLNFIFELQSGSYSFAKTFFLALLFGWGGLALILLCGFNRWLIFPAFFLVAFLGYRLGLGFVGCLQPSGAGGVACVIFCYLPLYLTAGTVFIVYICMVFSSICGACGVFSSAASIKRLLFKALPLSLVFAAAAFFSCILIPLLYKLFFM